MTYRDLMKRLCDLNDAQLNCDVTVELGLEGEFFAADYLKIAGPNDDVVDERHPVIYIKDA